MTLLLRTAALVGQLLWCLAIAIVMIVAIPLVMLADLFNPPDRKL